MQVGKILDLHQIALRRRCPDKSATASAFDGHQRQDIVDLRLVCRAFASEPFIISSGSNLGCGSGKRSNQTMASILPGS